MPYRRNEHNIVKFNYTSIKLKNTPYKIYIVIIISMIYGNQDLCWLIKDIESKLMVTKGGRGWGGIIRVWD